MTAPSMTQTKRPESVRTPGRTWTEFPEELGETGSGTVTVDAPDAVEVRDARPDELFEQIDADANMVTARHAEELEGENTVFVRVPAGTAVEEPIQVESDGTAGFFPHHIVVVAEPGSSAAVVERNTGAASTDSSLVEVQVGEDASLQYTKVNALGGGTGYADSAAQVAENASVDWLVLSTGADLYRNTVTTELAGRRSVLDYRLGFIAAGEQHMDHTAEVVHAADTTRCDMDSRGVAFDASRTVYKGVQEVADGAEGTKSFQDETTVLVGDDAEADTTPQLRIDNSDVEATHAATTGHVDEHDLFYMESRGLPEAAAKREIILGMFDDLVDEQEAHDAVRQKIRDAL